jgi:hypothetical protein
MNGLQLIYRMHGAAAKFACQVCCLPADKRGRTRGTPQHGTTSGRSFRRLHFRSQHFESFGQQRVAH